MVRLLDFKGHLRSEIVPAMVDAQGLQVVIQPQDNTDWAVDRVAAQSPDVPPQGFLDVPENTVVKLTMPPIQSVAPTPAPEVYLPHGEPLMATLMVRSKLPVHLELVVSPNVSFTVSKLKEQ